MCFGVLGGGGGGKLGICTVREEGGQGAEGNICS